MCRLKCLSFCVGCIVLANRERYDDLMISFLVADRTLLSACIGSEADTEAEAKARPSL